MMLILLIGAYLLIASAHTLSPVGQSKIRQKRLIGAKDATIETYPYTVSIYRSGNYACGGAIISKRLVLTAAHCITVDASTIKVRSGSTMSDAGGVMHDALYKALHSQFTIDKYHNSAYDIGVICVKQPFVYDTTRRSIGFYDEVLASDRVLPGTAVIAGWGFLTWDGPTSTRLQSLEVPFFSKNFCNDVYKTFGGIKEGQICAGHLGVRNKDVCPGDSGSPLVLDGKLIGVVAYSETQCGQFDYPTVYTEVAYFRDWIQKYMDINNLQN